MRSFIFLLFSFAACSSASPVSSSTGAGGSDADGGVVTLFAGSGGGGGSSVTLVDGGELSVADAASAQDGGGPAVDGGEVDAGPAVDCRIFVDTFERPDSADVGEAEYPAGSVWIGSPSGLSGDPTDYDIVDGSLVLKSGFSSVVASHRATVESGARLRYRFVKDATVQFNLTEGDADSGVRLVWSWNGFDFNLLLCLGTTGCVGSDSFSSDPTTEYFVELVFDPANGMASVAASKDAYASEGGAVVAELDRDLIGVILPDGDLFSVQLSSGALREVYLERWPCEAN